MSQNKKGYKTQLTISGIMSGIMLAMSVTSNIGHARGVGSGGGGSAEENKFITIAQEIINTKIVGQSKDLAQSLNRVLSSRPNIIFVDTLLNQKGQPISPEDNCWGKNKYGCSWPGTIQLKLNPWHDWLFNDGPEMHEADIIHELFRASLDVDDQAYQVSVVKLGLKPPQLRFVRAILPTEILLDLAPKVNQEIDLNGLSGNAEFTVQFFSTSAHAGVQKIARELLHKHCWGECQEFGLNQTYSTKNFSKTSQLATEIENLDKPLKNLQAAILKIELGTQAIRDWKQVSFVFTDGDESSENGVLIISDSTGYVLKISILTSN
jgi:hypothetical protein